jgi:NADH:ubiquinone oxidoreductase subunit 2 (subunit N)
MNGNGSEQPHEYLPGAFALIGLLMILKSFSERKSPLMSWLLLIMNHFWIALAISFNERFELTEVIFYLSGVIISGIIGYWGILKLKSYEQNIDLNQFHGHSFEHPKLALVFLLACLGLAGFPITPTFIGLDLVFSHIHENQVILAYATASSYILAGISLIRLYSRLFLGPHIKTYHETPYKSS